MAVKILGTLIVIISGSFLGILKKAELSYRVEQLDKVENALVFLQNEIEISGKLLCDALKESRYKLFVLAAELIEKNGILKGFEQAVLDEKLPCEEKEIIMAFAKGLVAEDVEGQINNIKLCAKRISMLKKQRDEKKRKLGKLYLASGFLGSMAFVIIFI